jgi:hypothetical protein
MKNSIKARVSKDDPKKNIESLKGNARRPLYAGSKATKPKASKNTDLILINKEADFIEDASLDIPALVSFDW